MTANPLCSIILVSYNNFRGNTGPCLESLRQDPAPMEIIVVDNNSDEETQTLLSQAAGEDSRIRLLFNPENRGYAGGNNDGAALATSDIIILLNNDTVVPPGAMPRLATLLQEHPHWHMLGPVTNNSGNEQRIFTSGTTAKEILAQGARWCAEGKGFVYPTDLLGFFCVAIRRQVYQQMKGLDEAYGLGFYEDTDFCYRAHQAGLTLMVTEDVFIFHQRSATFSRFPQETKRLLKANRRLFQQKHGTTPGGAHVRDRNLQVLQRYREAITRGTNMEGFRYRAGNRLQIAEELRPNSPLKKFLYSRKLQPLQRFFLSTV